MDAVRGAAIAIFLVAGCGGDGDVSFDAPIDVAIDIDARIPGGIAELGTGTTAFEPLTPEQELGLVTGPQGGYHFIVHSRITEMAPGDFMRPGLPENPVTLFEVWHDDGRQIDKLFPPYHIGYMEDPEDPARYVLPSGRILQIEEAEVPAIYGQRARITLRVSDTDGKVATDERWVTVIPYDGG